MDEMRLLRLVSAAAPTLAVAMGLASACADNDHTVLCFTPACLGTDAGLAGTGGTGGSVAHDGGTERDAGPPPPEPCEITFVTPTAADAGAITLADTDDVDGEACGPTFSARVVLKSTASSVNLFVNDNPLGAQQPESGLATFDAELGNRGDTANTLRAEATMADGRHCSAGLGRDVFVGCLGPSCSIGSPRANREGFLNQSEDRDENTPGLQLEVTVETEAENVGQEVRLSLDEDFDVVPSSVVALETGVGRATFTDVSLEEGVRQVRAECRDAFDLVTWSPIVEWRVDITSCSLELDGIVGDSDPITPADDIDVNILNGIDVLAHGHIEGDDCAAIQVGPCNDDSTEINLHGILGEDGGFLVPVKLRAQTASIDWCAWVTDTAGNASEPPEQLQLDVRVDSPSVLITSPTSNTRYNLAGTSGATADGNGSSEATCEVDVVVSCSDVGVDVELLADGDGLATAPCLEQGGLGEPYHGQATFSGVSLPSLDDGSSTTLRARQTLPGLPPGNSGNVVVRPDCNAPSCSFDSPSASDPFLNATLDQSSGDPGLQLDIVVATDATSAGEPVRLTLDGDDDNALVAPAASGSGGATALFAGVSLSETSHDVQATCTDAAGNVQTTSLVSWTVDLTPCSTTLLVAAGGNPIVPSDDLDGSQIGLQVPVAGQSNGTSCSAARVGLCDSISGAFTDLELDGSFELPATLPGATATNLPVCAEVRDEAGNVASSQALVNVRVDAPLVTITAPAPGTAFDATGGCGTTVVVSCSEDGEPVEVFEDGVTRGTQLCAGGIASFPFTLVTKNDGEPTELSAVQTAQGVPSVPANVNVQADCEAPLLSFSEPACNSQLALVGDDVDNGTAGLQIDVAVLNGGAPEVTLTVTTSGSTDIVETGDETSTEFPSVTLGGAGNVTLDACATDAQGNTACAPSCELTVVAEPTINITNPRPPAVFTIDDDCDADVGLQVQVTGTSNAADGSPVVVRLGTATASTPTLSGGTFTACVQAPDGEDQTLSATVTDAVTSLSRSTSVIVSVNTEPPAVIGPPTVAITGRRQGTLNLTWNSVLDSGGDPLVAYHVRCARADITTEAEWDTATALPVTVTPSSVAGTPQTQGVTNFRTGMQRFCMVRGQDAYGLLSPLGTTATVANPFLTLPYASVNTSTSVRVSVAALGDINGDGNADFAYGTQTSGAQVFFGGSSLDAAPDIVITGPAASEFGANVAGLGDINGDGRPDFAVTSRTLTHPTATNGGSVFVFFGRDSGTLWPSSIAVAASPGCGADLCFHSSEGTAGLGASVTSTNFDGTGTADIVIGAQVRTQSAVGLVGRVYVVLGGTQLNVSSGTIIELPAGNPQGFAIDPTTASRSFGVNVAAVGLGGDTRGDLVISALGRASPSLNGEAFSVLGQAYTGPGLDLIAAGQPFAVGTGNTFGNPMRALGDINGDTRGDVWIATNFDANGISPAYLGRTGTPPFSGVSLFSFTNDVVDNDWGSYVASGFSTELGRLGDLDGNGFDDVAVGSLFANGTPGTVELFYSDASTQNRLRSTADARFVSAGNGHMTPGFVGDISGDGFRDMVLLDSGLALTPTRLTLLY